MNPDETNVLIPIAPKGCGAEERSPANVKRMDGSCQVHSGRSLAEYHSAGGPMARRCRPGDDSLHGSRLYSTRREPGTSKLPQNRHLFPGTPTRRPFDIEREGKRTLPGWSNLSGYTLFQASTRIAAAAAQERVPTKRESSSLRRSAR